MLKQPIGVFISGRGTNLQSIVKACKLKDFPGKVEIVFSNNHEAAGLKFARKNNINVITLDYSKYKDADDYDKEIIRLLKPHKLKLICLAGYMRILSKKIINQYPDKIINIHPSLLPDYKGLNTHRRVIENNETITGCTVHYVNQELDGGKIILQKKVKIDDDETEISLAEKVLKEEHAIYPEAIRLVLTR